MNTWCSLKFQGNLPWRIASHHIPSYFLHRQLHWSFNNIGLSPYVLLPTFVMCNALSLCYPCFIWLLVFIQDHLGISNLAPADAPLRLLSISKADSGSETEESNTVVDARIHDYISNLQLCISPTPFFQVSPLVSVSPLAQLKSFACNPEVLQELLIIIHL